MSDNTTVRQSEFVSRRASDSFDQFGADVVNTFVLDAVSLPLLALVVLLVAARVAYRAARPAAAHPKNGVADAASWGIVWGVLGALSAFGLASEVGILRAALGGGGPPDWRVAVAGVAVPLLVLIELAAVASVYRILVPSRPPAVRDTPAVALALAMGLAAGVLAVWWVMAYYAADAVPPRPATDALLDAGGNAVKWYAFVGSVLALGAAFVASMYLLDARSAGWAAALPLAALRTAVYALLCAVFLLPAEQTWERNQKGSRVVILLDISPSVTDESDEVGGGASRKRIELLIDALTDDKVALLKGLLANNPVAVYAFGSRLDENPVLVPQGSAAWSKDEWRAFSRYDFKPILLRSLPDDRVRTLVQKSPNWGKGPGTPDWAETWAAQRRRGDAALAAFAGLEPTDDLEALRKALDAIDKRVEVARTIAQGTNVPDAVTAALNREESNLVQGLIVLSDGRSNLGSEAAYGELRERAARTRIPVFTVLVGKDVDRTAINITDVQAPEGAPVDEAWKVIVEATGAGLPGRSVDVTLELFGPTERPEGKGDAPPPARDFDKVRPDRTFVKKLTFSGGQPPNGQVEFVIDPEKLDETDQGGGDGDRRALTELSEGEKKKRNFIEGKWAVRARIPRDPQEVFPDPVHVSAVKEVTIVKKKLRVLLVAGAPSREFAFVRTLMMREAQNERATLTTLIQNEAGLKKELTAEQKEQIITRFPDRYDPNEVPADPAEGAYNFDQYDVLVAFDPDWSELSETQAAALKGWVTSKGAGGGLILVAGGVNTVQLGQADWKGRLRPVLDVLPAVPRDPVSDPQARPRDGPSVARRLILNHRLIAGSDLLKLDDKGDDPVAGWERFFTDRDRYDGNPDRPSKDDLTPARGFYSCFPLVRGERIERLNRDHKVLLEPSGLKPGAVAVAEFVDEGEGGTPVKLPFLVLSNPNGDVRTCFLASGELHKLRAYEAAEGTGREYFERVWVKLIKYAAGKRAAVAKPTRGTMLAPREALAGGPFRVQARLLNEKFEPYADPLPPTFTVSRLAKPGDLKDRKAVHSGPMQAQKNPDGTTSGYFLGELVLDPAKYPADGAAYAVEVELPAIPAGGGRTGAAALRLPPTEFTIRSSNPERDNVRPDPAAMVRMAGPLDRDFQARIPGDVRSVLTARLPKEGGVPRLAFQADDPELLKLIPRCLKFEERAVEVRGPVYDLWDRPLVTTVGGPRWRVGTYQITRERVSEAALWGGAVLGALALLWAGWAAAYRARGAVVWALVAAPVLLAELALVVIWAAWGAEVRLLDMEMTHKRANDGMLLVAIAGGALLALRGVWAAVSGALGQTAYLAVVLTVLAAELGALVAWGVCVGRGTPDWFFAGDWFFFVLALGLFFFQALAFRAEWGVGLAVLAVVAGAGLGLHLWAHRSPFDPLEVKVSAVLLAVVGLLATEWFCRKMVRLA